MIRRFPLTYITGDISHERKRRRLAKTANGAMRRMEAGTTTPVLDVAPGLDHPSFLS